MARKAKAAAAVDMEGVTEENAGEVLNNAKVEGMVSEAKRALSLGVMALRAMERIDALLVDFWRQVGDAHYKALDPEQQEAAAAVGGAEGEAEAPASKRGSKTEGGFPEALRLAREKAGLSAAQLGEKAGLHYASIRNYETGKGKPREAARAKLAKALGITPEELGG